MEAASTGGLPCSGPDLSRRARHTSFFRRTIRMDESRRLARATADFRRSLEASAPGDAEAAALMDRLAPLFARIERGEVVPPATGLYKAMLHSEHPRHGAGTSLFSAESAFVAALEDWQSRPWYPR